MARRRKPRLEVVDLETLRQDPENLRVHPERNRSAVRSSIDRFGAARSVVIDGDGVIRAGNGTVSAAIDQGLKEAVVVEVDGDQVVAVRRRNWTPEEAAAYAVVDNKTSDLSEFDYEALAAKIPEFEASGMNLESLGWEADWSPPAPTSMGLTVDRSVLGRAIKLTPEQRDQFDEMAESIAAGKEMTDGDVVVRLCEIAAERGD